MNGLQRLAQPLPLLWFLMVPLLLLQLLPPAATASRLLGGKAAGSAGSKRTLGTTAFTRSWLIDSSSGSSSRESSTCIFSRGRFLLHPRLRVRRLSRGSGGSHLLELARQRLLLHREGDVEKYMNTPIMPFPAVGEVHSQKKRCKAPPPRALLSGPLALHRQTKMLLRRHRGTRNNRRVLLLRDRLTLLLQQQQELLCESTQPSRSLLRKLWDLDKPSQPRQQQADEHRLQQQHGTEEQQQENQKANGRLQRRLTRPLGSKFLFVCGVDLNAAATDLENLFQTITEHPVHARLRRNKDGRHLGFGLIEFGSTLDATRCLLQLNGLKIGNSVIRLGEALGLQRSFEDEENQQGTELQQNLHQRGSIPNSKPRRYVHPYPLPCE